MSTNLSIKGKTQGNDAVTSTINYVNPTATNANLVSLATAFNNLTTNTISDITRIDKNSLINTVEKLPRNLQISPTTLSWQNITTDTMGTDATITGAGITTDTSEELSKSLYVSRNLEGGNLLYLEWYGEGNGISILLVAKKDNTEPVVGTITFTLPETETYQESSITLEITA